MAAILLFVRMFTGYLTDGGGNVLTDDDGNRLLPR